MELRDHLVIIGANDVGKTSVLRLLDMLLGATTQQHYRTFTSNDIRTSADELVVEARLEGLTPDEVAQFPFAITVEPGVDDYLTVRLEVRVDDNEDDSVVVERFAPDAGSRRNLSRDQLSAIGWRYLPADRPTNADAMNGRNSAFRTMLDAVDIGAESAALGGLLNEFNSKLESNHELHTLRATIAAQLSRSVPRAYTSDSLAIRTAEDPFDEPLQDVSIFLRDGNQLRSLADQSDGMRQLMSLTFFDLAQSLANIVAVDEPEMHLHPPSQRTIASLFAESTQQRLVVTHSPYIVQRFEPKHVLVINPNSEARQIASTNFSSVEKEMLQWWSPQLLEGLTARRILFVEGLADKIIVEAEAAAAASGINLDRIGVSLFALDGADKFNHVLKVVGKTGFNLTISGICDEDREDSWATHLKLAPKKLSANGFFVARSDLEHEYVAAVGAKAVAEALISARTERLQGILQSTETDSLDELTDAALADYLVKEDRRKVPAARTVAQLLTEKIVARSGALSGLIDYLRKFD
ncbi:ATP-binding protein [Curtobacterium flaccumfaciens pv. flaccumfaciens]|uniref:ATP-dependent nuclease n=1 Tax=Curtobacterium flaccumfaciens TaxID=2035 RepID=UPI001BCB674A|nr:AAA family ATPase [Curtobacterium flaccumfaciens]QVG65551.1 ATP-binding protein [Curtobacterium flaccumfaciens pv. flaccumfaciens]